MRLLLAFAFAVAIPSSAALAFDATPEGVPKPKKERKICKEIPRSGSNLPERRCLTAQQWLEWTENGGDVDSLAVQHKEKGAVSGVLSGMGPR